MITDIPTALKFMQIYPECFEELGCTERFARWIYGPARSEKDNLHILLTFQKHAITLRNRGRKEMYGANMIVEHMRWEEEIAQAGEGLKISAFISPYLSRLTMLGNPELMGMFRTVPEMPNPYAPEAS